MDKRETREEGVFIVKLKISEACRPPPIIKQSSPFIFVSFFFLPIRFDSLIYCCKAEVTKDLVDL